MSLSESLWYALSLLLLLSAFVHLVRRTRLSQRGFPRAYDVLLFAALIFGAAYAFELGQVGQGSLLVPFYHVIQIAGGDRDVEAVILPEAQPLRDILRIYSEVLYVITPMATLLTIVSYLFELLTVPQLRLLSLSRDVVVLSQLDERSLRMARSICGYYARDEVPAGDAFARTSRRACIVFAGVDREQERELAGAAFDFGAICTSLDVKDILGNCAHRHLRTIILSAQDEVRNIAEAKALAEQLRRACAAAETYRIIAVTSLRNSETVLIPEPSQDLSGTQATALPKNLVLRSFDPTRALVEQIVDRYPIFLKSNPHSSWDALAQRKGVAVGPRRLDDLYVGDQRHVVVVGAGTAGMEFVGSALWASRIDGVHTRIDVLDREPDPTHPTATMAEARFAALAPEVMRQRASAADVTRDAEGDAYTDESYDLAFTMLDAQTQAYADFIVAHAATISYVLIALGSDPANIKAALRTRQLLERELVRRSGGREAYLSAPRPLIIAVVENDELADIVEGATSEGQPYDIVCAGRLDEVCSYENLLGVVGERRREYDRRSDRANRTHRKYRLFAYLRNLRLGRHGLPALEEPQFERLAGGIDWTSDPAGWPLGQGGEAVAAYNAYRLTERAAVQANEGRDAGEAPVEVMSHALDADAARAGDGKPSREWLLRMEHERWNAYIRAEGFELALPSETATLFDTGQLAGGAKLHRSNLAALHPCLVPFDALAELDEPIAELYEQADKPGTLHTTFQLQDDEYIGV